MRMLLSRMFSIRYIRVSCFNAQNPKCLSGANTWLVRFEVKCQTSKPSEAKGTVNHNLRKTYLALRK